MSNLGWAQIANAVPTRLIAVAGAMCSTADLTGHELLLLGLGCPEHRRDRPALRRERRRPDPGG